MTTLVSVRRHAAGSRAINTSHRVNTNSIQNLQLSWSCLAVHQSDCPPTRLSVDDLPQTCSLHLFFSHSHVPSFQLRTGSGIALAAFYHSISTLSPSPDTRTHTHTHARTRTHIMQSMPTPRWRPSMKICGRRMWWSVSRRSRSSLWSSWLM